MPTDEERCFGKYWEENNPECKGGPDPSCGRVRQRCELYEQCGRAFRMGQATQRMQQPPRPAHVPVSAPLTTVPARPLAPYYVPPAPVPVTRPYSTGYTQPQPSPSPQQFYPAVMHPVQSLLPNEAPAFLTVMEPSVEGVPLWQRIMAESVRAALKGVLAHSSFVVDHTTYFHTPPDRK
jgi:hypothetical protein